MNRRSLVAALCTPALLRIRPVRAASREITIPIASTSFGTSGLRAARDLGLFERHGLNARIVVADSGNAALSALLGGSADAAEGASGELIAARARGQPVIAIADLYRGYTGTVALATTAAQRSGVAPDAPVFQRLRALDGLVIAAPSATSIYTLGLKQAAEAAGAKIRFTYMAQPAMGAALEAGAIQGMISGSPFWAGPVVRGVAVRWISGPRQDFPAEYVPLSSALLIAREETVRTDRDLVQRLRAAVADLGTAIADRPDQVAAAEAKLYSNLDPASLKLMLDTEMLNLRTEPLTVATMRHEIDYVRSSGMVLPGLDTMDPAALLAGY